MTDKKYQLLRTKFLLSYANLPLGVRNEIVAVLGDEPVSWRLAYSEIRDETETGKEILNFLDRLEIIKL